MNRFRSIRFRLTIWNSLVVLLVTSIALLVARQGMVYTLEGETRQLLAEELTELELAVQQLHPDQQAIFQELERKVLGHQVHRWYAEIQSSAGVPLWRSDNFPEQFETTEPFTKPFQYRQFENHIVCYHPVATSDGQQFVLMLGEPTTFIQREAANLTQVLFWVGCLVLLIAPFGGYLLAYQALLPVREIIASTRALNPSGLNNPRLELRGSQDELDQISAEINSFIAQLESYNDSQREFIANAAHELRSPLTAIQTGAEVCLNQPRDVEEYREQLETTIEQCQQLRRLVNQLLELAETDAGIKLNRKPINFSQQVANCVSFFSGFAEEQNVALEPKLQANVIIEGDASKLTQVLNNLIDNAIKFTPAGGQVGIKLETSNGFAWLTVSDTGSGVPAEKLERIFDRFYQLESSRNRDLQQGNGLGLSICRSIVRLHGGTISAAAQIAGKTGLVISVSLPCCNEA